MIIAVRLTPSRTNSDIEFDYMSRRRENLEELEERRRARKRGEESGREEKVWSVGYGV